MCPPGDSGIEAKLSVVASLALSQSPQFIFSLRNDTFSLHPYSIESLLSSHPGMKGFGFYYFY